MVAILPIIDYFLRIFERPHVMIAHRHPSQDTTVSSDIGEH